MHPRDIALQVTGAWVAQLARERRMRPRDILQWTPGELVFLLGESESGPLDVPSPAQRLRAYYRRYWPDRVPQAPAWLMPEVPRV